VENIMATNIIIIMADSIVSKEAALTLLTYSSAQQVLDQNLMELPWIQLQTSSEEEEGLVCLNAN
jgi:type IV secretory pathway VirB3-like protein